MRSDVKVTVAPEDVTYKAASATRGQDGSVFVIVDSVAPATEAAASAMSADVRFVQVTGDVGSQ